MFSFFPLDPGWGTCMAFGCGMTIPATALLDKYLPHAGSLVHFFILHLFMLYVHTTHTCMEVKGQCESQFSLSTIWVLELSKLDVQASRLC